MPKLKTNASSLLPKKLRLVQITPRIPEDLKRQVEAAAAQTSSTVQDLCEASLRFYLQALTEEGKVKL